MDKYLGSFGAREALLELMSDGALVVDAGGKILSANRAAKDVLEASDGIQGTALGAWFAGSAPVEQLLAGRRAIGGKPRWLVVTNVKTGADVLIAANPQFETGEYAVLIKPFGSAVASLDRIVTFATRDPVTQLLNREAFQEELAAGILDHATGAVICADINGFSAVNSVYGQGEGDILLRAVAHRLRPILPAKSPFSRMYGGRFAIFLPIADSGNARSYLAKLADDLHRAMAAPFGIAGGSQPIQLSVGIARWPADATDADELIRAAETAIQAIPASSRLRTRWFEPAMQAERRALLEIGAELRHAIEHGELELHYQPKVRWSDRHVVGFEALCRWKHPTKGWISPATFIPVAEQSNLIVDLGNWVLHEACRQQAAWRDQGLKLLPVAVNVSPHQVVSHSVEELLAPLAEYNLSLGAIEIEITESAMMDRLSAAQNVVESLRQSGIGISIDDFGTGHSSLGNLRRLPIDTLKIDRSFVEDIDHSSEAFDIVATIAAMAKALSLNVVAEGVETEAQATLLCAHGIDVMQGYLFSRPLAADHATKLLEQPAIPRLT